MTVECDEKLICDAWFKSPKWMQTMSSFGTVWGFLNEKNPRAHLGTKEANESKGATGEGSIYVVLSVTKHSDKRVRARGVDAKIELLKECLKPWVWSDENAHEIRLPDINVTLNIDDLWAKGTSADDEGIVVDMPRLISPASSQGTLDSKTDFPTYGINSGTEADFTLRGFQDGETYVVECVEQEVTWKFVPKARSANVKS